MKRLLYLLVPGLLLLGFALGYLSSPLLSSRSPKTVETRVVAMRDFVPRVSADGKVWPRVTVKISSKRAGAVEAIYFEEGQLVKKGEALVKLEDANQNIEVAQAEGALARARADLEKKKARANPGEDIAAAQAEVSYREARLVRAKQGLAESLLTAPISGVLERIYAQPGQWVAKGGKIVELVDLTRTLVKAEVQARDLGLLNRGAWAQIQFDPFPDRTFLGRVIHVSSTPDRLSQAFPVDIEIDNADLLLKAGMLGRVEITTSVRTKLLMVPKAAIISRSDNKGLFIIAQDRAIFRNVETGAEGQGYVEVKKNVKAGELVVTSGQASLKDGDRVIVRKSQE